jgi:hypothetical protein
LTRTGVVIIDRVHKTLDLMNNSQRVLETGVSGSGINQVNDSQLRDISEALK